MSKNLFSPIDADNQYQYRAVGVVRGKYYPSTEDFNIGTLATNSAVIQASINSKQKHHTNIKPDMIEKGFWFSVYPRTKKYADGVVKLAILKPYNKPVDIDSYFSIRGDLVAINDSDFLVRIHYNWNLDQFFYLRIKGTLPCADINNFWDIECVLSGQFLQLVKGQVVGESKIVRNPKPDQQTLVEEGIFAGAGGRRSNSQGDSTPPELKPLNQNSVGVLNPCSKESQPPAEDSFPPANIYQPNPDSSKLAVPQVAEQVFVKITEQITTNPTKVTTVKSEITLKFNEIPTADPAPNKKVKLTLSDEHENRFIVLLNSKSYKKAAEFAASYPKYAGNISGKLGKLTADGFEVLDAGIKIFEIKSQPQAQEQESA